MNDNTNLFTHIKTDPNAPKHAIIGGCMSALGVFVALYVGGMAWLAPLIFPLCSGIGIEIIQRIRGGQNTTRESVMDIMTTWLWPVFYIVR